MLQTYKCESTWASQAQVGPLCEVKILAVWGLKSTHGMNSLAPGKFEWKFRYVIFKRILVIDGWGISSEIALIWLSLGLHWWSVNIGSGNGLVPSGNKPLPKPMLTQISWRHMVSLGHNELICNMFKDYTF